MSPNRTGFTEGWNRSNHFLSSSELTHVVYLLRRTFLNAIAVAMICLAPIAGTAAVLYVDASSTNPIPPFADWSTAAVTIQDAVDAAGSGDQILVTNGVYWTGGRVANGALTNRVAVTKPVTVQSVNGPAWTMIQGNHASPGFGPGSNAIRCVYLTNNAALIGFTLTNGATLNTDAAPDGLGGGVYCETNGLISTFPIVSNCLFISNSAAGYGGGECAGVIQNCRFTGNRGGFGGGGSFEGIVRDCFFLQNSAYMGGGVYGSTKVYNSILISNSASFGGGAAFADLSHCIVSQNKADANGGGLYGGFSHADNCLVVSNQAAGMAGGAYYYDLLYCTVVGNSSTAAGPGGTYSCELGACIVYYNSQKSGNPKSANYSGGFFTDHSCTIPMPADFPATSITNEPGFANLVNGDFRLQSNSPCINSAYSYGTPINTDLDGNPRIAGGMGDIGAYEFQTPTSVLSYAWLQQYGLSTDGSADYTDNDSDGMNNWQEWIAGTNPFDAASALAMLTPVLTNNPPGLIVSWQSVPGITYYLQSGTNPAVQPAFSTIRTHILGQSRTTSFVDTNFGGSSSTFYRVGVQR